MSKRFHSFHHRLTRRIVIALALTLIIINASIYYLSDYAMTNMLENTFRNLLEVESQSLRTLLTTVESSSRNSIDDVEYWIDNPDEILNVLADELQMNPNIKAFAVAFEPNYFQEKGRWFEPYATWRDGKIEKTQIGSASHDYFNTEWYQNGIRAKKDYWSEPYLDKDGAQEMICTYAQPFFDKQGRRIGVFGVDVSLDWLHMKLRQLDDRINKEHIRLDIEQSLKGGGSYCFIIGHSGTYISHPEKRRILARNLFDEVKLTSDPRDDYLAEEIAARSVGFMEVIINNETAYVFHTPVKHTGWTMGFVVPKRIMKAHTFFFNIVILIVMTLSLFIVYWISRVTIHHATRPLQSLAMSADEVAKGNFNVPLPDLPHNDEIRQLRDSFDNMQHSLASYIEQEKTTSAEKAAMESELSIANKIQMSMLPPNTLLRDDISIYGTLTPAKAVGGDLFDFFIRDSKLFFCIGDVLGKSISAAMLMTVTRCLFRAYSANEDKPEVIITRINKMMCESKDSELFVTLFVGVFDLLSGHLSYCSAGHEPPMLIGRDAVELPFVPVFPVGSFPNSNYQALETVMAPGDILFLFTDGLNEAMNEDREMFKRERILTVVQQAIAEGNLSPLSLILRMKEAVDSFVGEAEQSDDLTMLAIQRLAPERTVT
ncbi:MAG: SpoIIE family protein phosphatase [Prevotella sp.]|nr:SpoIIE family protein phosphatase [Prevotella sp.]